MSWTSIKNIKQRKAIGIISKYVQWTLLYFADHVANNDKDGKAIISTTINLMI